MVKKGDTLFELSKKYNVPLEKIVAANPQIAEPDQLTVGEKVKIPTAAVSVGGGDELIHKHVVKQGDSLWKLSKAWGVPLQTMINANPQLKNPNALLVGEVVNIPVMKPEPMPMGSMPNDGNLYYATSAATNPMGKKNTAPIQMEEMEMTEPLMSEAPKAELPLPEPEPIQMMPTMPSIEPTPVMPHYHVEVDYTEINVESPPVYSYVQEIKPGPVKPKSPCGCDEKPYEMDMNLFYQQPIKAEKVASYYDHPAIPYESMLPSTESLKGHYPGITKHPMHECPPETKYDFGYESPQESAPSATPWMGTHEMHNPCGCAGDVSGYWNYADPQPYVQQYPPHYEYPSHDCMPCGHHWQQTYPVSSMSQAGYPSPYPTYSQEYYMVPMGMPAAPYSTVPYAPPSMEASYPSYGSSYPVPTMPLGGFGAIDPRENEQETRIGESAPSEEKKKSSKQAEVSEHSDNKKSKKQEAKKATAKAKQPTRQNPWING